MSPVSSNATLSGPQAELTEALFLAEAFGLPLSFFLLAVGRG